MNITSTNVDLTLRRSVAADLELFFTFQLDPDANHLAAFTAADPFDKAAYISKYAKFLDDPTINMQTILVGNSIVGSIAKFVMGGQAGITYWIDKKYWGKGVASKALQQFLQTETTRPIFGHVAFDNLGSQRVLEKAGFIRAGSDKGFANGRQAEVEEYIYKLT